MSERLVKVKLYGHLRSFGREFELYVKSPAEAIHALCVMVPGFRHYLETAEHKGIEFAVFNGRQNIGAQELELGAKPEIRIAPIYGGRKQQGSVQTIIGAIIIAIAIVYSGGSASAAFGAGGLGGGSVAMFGAAMMVGGVVQMMTPGVSGIKTKDDDENTSAYAFGGPVNTTAQGTPVGLLYGEREIGGAVISAGIYAEDRA